MGDGQTGRSFAGLIHTGHAVQKALKVREHFRHMQLLPIHLFYVAVSSLIFLPIQATMQANACLPLPVLRQFHPQAVPRCLHAPLEKAAGLMVLEDS